MLMAGERVEGEGSMLLPSPLHPPPAPHPRPSLHLLLRLVPACEQEVTSRKKQKPARFTRSGGKMKLAFSLMAWGKERDHPPHPCLHGKELERGTLALGGAVGILPDYAGDYRYQ